MQSNYPEKELRVLLKIYDLEQVMGRVVVEDLVKELRMEPQEVDQILLELEKRQLIDADEVSVSMNPAGLEVIGAQPPSG